jgi:hypothetical protein
MGSGENGKRYQLLIKPASPRELADRTFILTNQSIFFSTPAALRLQRRCNLDSVRDGAYTFFPLNLQFGEASGDAPV